MFTWTKRQWSVPTARSGRGGLGGQPYTLTVLVQIFSKKIFGDFFEIFSKCCNRAEMGYKEKNAIPPKKKKKGKNIKFFVKYLKMSKKIHTFAKNLKWIFLLE